MNEVSLRFYATYAAAELPSIGSLTLLFGNSPYTFFLASFYCKVDLFSFWYKVYEFTVPNDLFFDVND